LGGTSNEPSIRLEDKQTGDTDRGNTDKTSVPTVNNEGIKEIESVPDDDAQSVVVMESGNVWADPGTWTWPVDGELERSYTMEALAYDVTMADWRTHDGIDIAADAGTVVVAAADGTVESIEQDELYGTTVVISHGNGVKTVYSNLAETPTVRVGDEVKAGAVIGSVGDTAICEIGEPSHVHFAISKNGESVNPLDYLQN